jgi:hypothetical protein
MFAGELRRQRIVDASTAASRLAVHGDRNPDAGAAHRDSPVRGSPGDGFGELTAELRIIDALGAVRSKVLDIVALLAQPSDELVLEGVAGMVGGEGDAHAY